MSYLPPDEIKQGYWVDESRGPILGATITCTTDVANVTIAVLAVVVSVASVYLWHLILFACYQTRAGQDTGDGLYRQQQVLLRNQSGSEKTFLDLAKLAWIWRGKTKNPVRRSLRLGLLSLAFSAAAIAVSVSSSFIVDTSNIKVLVTGSSCGHPTQSSEMEYISTVAKLSLDYAEACYLKEAQSQPCIKYLQPKIDFTTVKAPCPFSSSMCVEGTSAISMDTGYLDSNDDFGFNAKPEDRIQIRRKTTCSPIRVPGYYTIADPKTDFPGEQTFRLQYGVRPEEHQPDLRKIQYSTYESNRTGIYVIQSEKDGPTYAVATGSGAFKWIPELQRKDADTILNFIWMNNVYNSAPTDDPVFSAHKKKVVLVEGTKDRLINVTYYASDYPLGVIGCAEQYQFCVPTAVGRNCTQLGELPHVDSTDLKTNKIQHALWALFWTWMFSMDMSLVGTGLNPLQASTSLSGGIQQGLPDNQWELEVKLWESFVLSHLQESLADHAIGPPDKSSFDIKPYSMSLCKRQIMRKEGGFANINVFGLAFTVALSGVIILLDIFSLRIFAFLSRYRKSWAARVNRWIQDGVLQLQRKAYEGMGEGEWARRESEVPIVRNGTLLSDFSADYPLLQSRKISADKATPLESEEDLNKEESTN